MCRHSSIRIFLLIISLMYCVLANASESGKFDPCIYTHRVISAGEIQNAAANGPITYQDVNIVGDLKLSGDKYESFTIRNSTFDGNLSIKSANIMDKAIFNNVSFRKNANFTNTNFNGEADFSGSCFHGAASFNGSSFIDSATFDYATFDKDADFSVTVYEKFGSFYNVTFGGNTTFFMSQFDGSYANLENTTFAGKLNFIRSKFSAPLSLLYTKILKDADFHESKFIGGLNGRNLSFLGDAKFSRCHFYEESIFRNNYFNNSVDFSNCRFDGPSFFDNSSFRGNALFNGVQFYGSSDFTDARIDGDLGLNSSKISTMILDGVAFSPKSRLFLAKADVNKLMVKWSSIKDTFFFDASAYLSLVKNYRDMGTSDADDCYYQFRSLTQDNRNWGWAKVLDILAGITCGYGVKADRPVVCSLFLIIACTTIFWVGRGLRSPADREKKTSFYDSLYYCLAVFFTIPLPDLKPQGRFRYMPVFLRAISWTLFALLIATLGKVMIK
jgi:hypothetical protein